MTDTSSSEGSATLADGKPVTGTPSGGATPPKNVAATLEEALARIAELEHATKNATEERDRHRKKLTAYEEAEKKAQEAQLSEVERTKKQHADLQSKYESDTAALISQIVNLRVKEIAAKLGIIDPDAAVRLIDDEFEVDDEGNVTNAEELLKALLKNKPYLAGTPAPTPASPQARQAPATPAMNPGRSTIAAPGQRTPGSIPTWEDVFKRPGR